ncbi:dihydrofolate reductase family protein [Amycolatopsis sp. lyj-108]|uniref:dihydrofolate reductase family protein n=1 Tax=Amycolatopsis sp. lyj-108 TaxID=2789286 RepID=UPI00397A8B25
MGRFFLHVNVSLDGYIADTAGDIDWRFADDEFQAHIDELLESLDGMAFGRKAYEELAGYWPTAGDEVSATQRRRMHELPKYVLSRTLRNTTWHNSHLIEDASALAGLEGDVALFAGGGAATSAARLGLLDEVRLVVNPVLLGGGTRLFGGEYAKTALTLVDERRFASGALLLTYSVAR